MKQIFKPLLFAGLVLMIGAATVLSCNGGEQKQETQQQQELPAITPDTTTLPADTMGMPGDTTMAPGDTMSMPGDTMRDTTGGTGGM